MSESSQNPPSDPGRVGLALPVGHEVMEYAIERTLGGGGFGITYLARDLNLGLPVALKEYLPADLARRGADGAVQSLGESSEPQFRWGLERFIDEARALATFSHPNIVRVLRYFATNGTAYIVMEYQSGCSLKQWFPRHSPIGRAELLRIILPLLDGLEKVHKAGFLHRDIKPDNIFVREDGTPVLLDFGAARRTIPGQDLTNIISPGFAPFEQYHSKGNQGPWTDLYSLAAVMYWLVSGNKPAESASRLKRDEMVPALRSDPHQLIGESILGAIDWALDIDESRRPQSAQEFRSRLVAGLSDGATLANTGDFSAVATRQVPATGFNPNATIAAGFAGEGQRGNVVCSILFVDIIAYSKTSVSEQYELKSRFNELVATRLSRHPENTRITLDTGDGAAICFMGDPEEVLHTAIEVRRALSGQERLRARMGLHIGPVRILNDLNGRGNVVGDGINVAQRVMSFADDRSLLVSRAFYDIVSCLSDRSDESFRHLGAQQDKHGRLHDLYEVLIDQGPGALFERTLRVGEDSSSMPSGIDPQLLAAIEQDLTQYIGPLAPILVRKARGRAASAEELRELLAQSITDAKHREAFLRGSVSRAGDNSATRRSRSADPGSSTTRVNRLGDTALAGSRSGAAVSAPANPVSQSVASVRPWLSQEAIDQLEKLLARLIGPMAKVLLKNELRRANDFAGLAQALALHIDNQQSRAEFLTAAAAARKKYP